MHVSHESEQDYAVQSVSVCTCDVCAHFCARISKFIVKRLGSSSPLCTNAHTLSCVNVNA